MISAGILIYRENKELEVFLIHPGDPYRCKTEYGVWSIPKGLKEDGEELIDTAIREFNEETGLGIKFDLDSLIDLGIVENKYKEIKIYAYNLDVGDNVKVVSNTFKMQWPPKSGKIIDALEADRGEYFNITEASLRINQNQIEFLNRLTKYLNKDN